MVEVMVGTTILSQVYVERNATESQNPTNYVCRVSPPQKRFPESPRPTACSSSDRNKSKREGPMATENPVRLKLRMLCILNGSPRKDWSIIIILVVEEEALETSLAKSPLLMGARPVFVSLCGCLKCSLAV